MSSFINDLDSELRRSVLSIIERVPEAVTIFQRVYDAGKEDNKEGRQSRKSQKLETTDGINGEIVEKSSVIFSLSEVSVLSPLRKKLDFALHLSPADRKPRLSLIKNGRQELTIEDLGRNVTLAVFLPVAEKLGNVYLFITYSESVNNKYGEPILITLNKDSVLKQFKENSIVSNETKDFSECIGYMRKQAILAGFRITDPFFTNSSEQQSPSFHVECHRGTKEGTLYFLPEHIIFGFKKPILVFQSSEIESITYTSITRLTFNVTLITKNGEKFEFSMIDQSEYNNIDDYVKRKQVTDKSMSEELKAKTNHKNVQTAQDENNEPSSLKEATQMMAGGEFNDDDDDDEQDDANFETGSESSDSNALDEEESDNEIADREARREEQHEEQHELEDVEAQEAEDLENDKDEEASDEIPIDVDDDNEGSGVEYD